MDAKPLHRMLEATATEVDGEKVVIVRDPTEPSDKAIGLTMPGFFVLSHCDGDHEIGDIQEAFRQQFNQELPDDVVLQMLEEFDKSFLLEGERYEAHRGKRLEAFRAQPTRPPVNAGSAYPADPTELRAMLDELVSSAEPGPATDDDVVALVVPHIDFVRGGATYGAVCRAMRELGREFDTCIILGIAHHATDSPFILTRKPYETPLGVPQVDEALIDRLVAHCSTDLFEDELSHAAEHSIEFGTILCQYLFGPAVKTVSILCGSFESFVPPGRRPRDCRSVSEVIAGLSDIVAETEERILIVAAVDFSHIGPQFGDSGALTDRTIEWAARRDQQLIEHIEACEADAFHEEAYSDGNATHVCGVAAVYTALAAIDQWDIEGALISYGRAPTPDGSSLVSFAGMLLIAMPEDEA